jgi:MFS family permease
MPSATCGDVEPGAAWMASPVFRNIRRYTRLTDCSSVAALAAAGDANALSGRVIMLAQIGTIILATSLVQLALGFFGTFISLKIKLEQFDAVSAGLVLSSYYAGFALGAVGCGSMIARVGYIRAYAAFAGGVVAAIAAMPIWATPLSWTIARCVIGFGCAGLFVATESWLNAKASPSQRGRVFSLYMVGLFVALALGQLLIIGADVAGMRAFNILTALFAVALIMVCTTRAESPQIAREPRLAYGDLARTAPLAVGAATVSGFIASCFYTLVPAWMQGVGIPQAHIGIIMLAAVLGGLVFQVPIGRVSDKLDRRLVIALVGSGFAFAALVVVWLPRNLPPSFPRPRSSAASCRRCTRSAWRMRMTACLRIAWFPSVAASFW